MAGKQFDLPGVGPISVFKRRGAKNIRLSVNSDGKIRVSQPTWLPYMAGVRFAEQKRRWLAKQSQRSDFTDGQRIGKYHTLHLRPKTGITKPQTRVTATTAEVSFPPNTTAAEIQTAAHEVCKRAARAEAEKLLPQRLEQLAGQYGFDYQSVSIRHLKTRWGSCSSQQNITLNYYLMQLPWDLIDYVLLHELVHTQELNHSASFWSAVGRCIPDYKTKRQQLKHYQPSLLLSKEPDQDHHQA